MILSNDVLKVLDRCQSSGALVRIPDKLDRPMYLAVNRALEAANGKWNRKIKAHVFATANAAEIIDSMIMTGEVTDARRDFDFFPTPPGLAEYIASVADIRPGHLVLEPSAGTGALVVAAVAAGGTVTAIERDPQRIAALKDTGATAVVEGDFLTIEPKQTGLFDRVIMNPPFSKRADIAHVHQACKFLKPGGKLAAVMAGGITFRQDRKAEDFRTMVEQCHWHKFEPLPDDSFKPSGTSVRTVLVQLQAPAAE